ncbi:hypothetical protein INQ42_10680 [Lysobacter avium]|uniref:Acyltransferase 3 domain-containing protein n=1 Tax=Novilysobacter avium TaxID=2781023 RepID=A0A7S6UJZ1_9GAMM|nr:hypothetical protein [Lysobacter avium]QOW21686.1 hypothetical protein INQ42_10680 [Lysobacter avium]
MATTPGVWAAITGGALDNKLNHHWFLFFGLVWSSLLLAVLHGPGWLSGLFSWAPMRLVGAVSFSAYLWHMPVLASPLARWFGTSVFSAWAVLAALMLVAMASFLVFERPWRELRLPAAAPAAARRQVG